MSIVQFRRIF